MIRRFLTIVVLFTMVLHSASRLGVLSYLYQQRNEIAYAIGLIAEIPIAMCNGNYHFNDDLIVVAQDDGASTVPPAIVTAKEINLFLVNTANNVQPLRPIAYVIHQSPVIEKRYSPPTLSIFHPPS